ncbi:DUF3820 family protein [Aliiglaciecola lipolytica]|uniref:Cytoplasmic protein n=1 Tax=Aliiglaciecola lipolytica E3 TaxID=1127673 RepID=K6XS30_9ALTE|nr:DUF3820 family protein [Aliiglaciecola lipolytica]GAC14486.1 hypothetical protein GLIP_1857 [Aliiglaciecola lipolytica E3]
MFDAKIIKEAVNQTMPFGKYAGRKLLHLPEPYLVWFHQKGFPSGKLGEQLALMYEVKLNGLESMLAPLLDDQEKLINQYEK